MSAAPRLSKATVYVAKASTPAEDMQARLTAHLEQVATAKRWAERLWLRFPYGRAPLSCETAARR